MKEQKPTISLLKKIAQKQILFGLGIVLGIFVILYFLTRAYIVAEAKESLHHTSYRIEQLLIQDQKLFSLFPLYEIHHVAELQHDTQLL